jgi:broad specificity phosphatase PhoE
MSAVMNVAPVRYLRAAVAAAMAAALLASCSSPPAPRTVTLTFIRHAETDANAAGIAATTVPGPPLTAAGEEQATTLANTLKGEDYDGIYASQMVRTQQTAAPMAKALGEEVTVLPGLNEISAGWFEGVSMKETSSTLLLGPEGWLKGDRRYGIPGSVNGNQFNQAFSAAVQKIYDSGDNKPVAFSSGLAIMMWTLLNARNGRNSLLNDRPLPNTAQVVIKGNPFTGWTLESWDGITNFAPEAD